MTARPSLPGPFATATVARIYLAQGKLDQAEAIFRELRARRPDDPVPARGLAEVAARRRALADAAAAEALELTWRDGALRCRWRVTEAGVARGRLLLADGGRADGGALVLHLAGFSAAGPTGAREIPLAARQGEMDAAPPAGALALAVAVGLRAGDRFVPIVHHRVQAEPRAEPT